MTVCQMHAPAIFPGFQRGKSIFHVKSCLRYHLLLNYSLLLYIYSNLIFYNVGILSKSWWPNWFSPDKWGELLEQAKNMGPKVTIIFSQNNHFSLSVQDIFHLYYDSLGIIKSRVYTCNTCASVRYTTVIYTGKTGMCQVYSTQCHLNYETACGVE